MPRNPVEKNSVDWEARYGTTISGNLPKYKTKECVSDIITNTALSGIQVNFPWVTISDFHYYHFKCPYSTEAKTHFVRDTDRQSDTYWQMVTISGSPVSHTTTSGLMIRFSRGSKHGWLCVDPICPYYNDPANGGLPYFYT